MDQESLKLLPCSTILRGCAQINLYNICIICIVFGKKMLHRHFLALILLFCQDDIVMKNDFETIMTKQLFLTR